MAVEVLKERGVLEERILFLNLISSPEGIERFSAKFPKLHVVTAFIDQGLDEKKFVICATTILVSALLTHASYIVPGLGDFGDRFFTV